MRRPVAGWLAGVLAGALACAGTSSDSTWSLREIAGRSAAAPRLVESSSSSPAPPGNLRATHGELREISLAWSPVREPGVAGYVVERSLSEGGPFSRVAVLTDAFDTGLLDRGFDLAPKSPATRGEAGLGDGAVYFYRVRSFDAAGAISAQASAVVEGQTAPLPAPPGNPRVISRLPRKTALEWSASEDPNVKGYVVSRSPGPTGPFEPIAEVAGRHSTHFVDRGLGDLRVFYYRIASKSRTGAEGPPSEPVLALTKPDPLPPAGLRIAERSGDSAVIAWERNIESDIVEYRVLRRDEAGAEPSLIGTVGPAQTSLRDAGAAPRASYLVIAVDADGLESAPAEIPLASSEGGARPVDSPSVATPGR